MPRVASTAVADLQRVGYPVVEQEVPLDPDQRSKLRVDVVAWASDETGSLAPAILVELKKSQAGSADAVLSQLARYATILGTREQYLFDGAWWRADESFTRLEAVDGPRPPRVSSDGRLNDPALVHRLLAGRLTREI